VAAAVLSARAAGESAAAAKISATSIKQQNEISLLEKRIEIRNALARYANLLIAEGWNFDEGKYLAFMQEINDASLYFPNEIVELFSQIDIKTNNFLGQRDDIGLTDDEDEKSTIIQRIKPMKNEIRDESLNALKEIRKFMREGILHSSSL
jgi:hypothetical protein